MIVLHQLMRVDISQLEPADVSAADDLMKRYSGTIGFLPSVVLEEHLRKKWVLGATTKEGQLAGYLLYAAYPDRFRIVQLCVSDSHRNQGIARKLVEALKATATTQKVIRLSCRNDYEAHCMWPKLGFVPILEKAGRSRQGHLLTIWRLALAPEDQLALFRANISDDILDVVIDAQIFFDFNEPDNDTTLSSKTLLSDFLVDSIQIWFTDELFVEINRNQKDEERRTARDRAGQFLELRHDPILVKELEESLKGILPSHSQSQQSDINHLAKTAASDVKVFVTRDEALLKKAKEISNSLHVRILSPIELIMQQRELCEIEPYMPDRVAGLSLEWRRLNSNEFSDFPFNHFLEQGERENRLRHKVESFLLDSKHEVEVLYSKNKPTAFRVVSYDSTKTLTVSLGRVGNAGDRSLFGRFLISDVIYKAMRKDLEMVKFEGSGLPTSLMQGLSEMRFTRCGDYFVRFCFTRHLDHQDILQEITELCPAAVDKYRRMPHLELERHCSPLISETDQDFFLIPIRKGYAFNLFDRHRRKPGCTAKMEQRILSKAKLSQDAKDPWSHSLVYKP